MFFFLFFTDNYVTVKYKTRRGTEKRKAKILNFHSFSEFHMLWQMMFHKRWGGLNGLSEGGTESTEIFHEKLIQFHSL